MSWDPLLLTGGECLGLINQVSRVPLSSTGVPLLDTNHEPPRDQAMVVMMVVVAVAVVVGVVGVHICQVSLCPPVCTIPTNHP